MFQQATKTAHIGYAFHAEAIALHHVNHPEIDFQSPTEATGTWYLKDWFCDLKNKIYTDGSSLYRDTYVKVDGEWKISHTGYERIYEEMEPRHDDVKLTSRKWKPSAS